MSPTTYSSGDLKVHIPAMDPDRSSDENREYDVHIITSGGLRIPAHASVLVINLNWFD